MVQFSCVCFLCLFPFFLVSGIPAVLYFPLALGCCGLLLAGAGPGAGCCWRAMPRCRLLIIKGGHVRPFAAPPDMAVVGRGRLHCTRIRQPTCGYGVVHSAFDSEQSKKWGAVAPAAQGAALRTGARHCAVAPQTRCFVAFRSLPPSLPPSLYTRL
jgi:hypothetical protein